MIARDPTDAKMWLLSLPPTRRQTQWVVAVAVCQVAAFALLAPFAKIQLARINAFIPAFEGVIFVTDLVTSVLLFSQFASHRLRCLLVLACGYLFSAMMIIPHLLTFPDAFSPTGLLGAGPQTSSSLYWFWHWLFLLALLGYGLMRDEKSEPARARASLPAVIGGSVALVLALVCGLTLLATAGQDYLPPIFLPERGLNPARYVVGAIAILVCVSTLAALWLRRRSLLDQWVMIVTLAAILELGLNALIVTRFSLGFYAGRRFSLLTSTIVLVVLLVETSRLYVNVARSNEGKIRRLVDANILGICIWNLEGTIVEANEALLNMLQYDREDVVSGGLRWTDLTPPELRERDERAVAELRSTGTFQQFEKEYLRKDGSRVPVLMGGALFEESRNEGVAFVLDLTDRKRAELLLAVEKRSLEMISSGASLDEILNYLCNSIDALASGPVSTVLMMDSEGHQLWHVAGPRVPRSWLPAIMPRPVGPCEGCCGTAAYRKERVIVADVLTDPVWSDDYRGFAVENGIRAAWSEPLLTKDGEVLGTFALYSAEPGMPTAAEIELIEGASHIALIAMVQQRSQAALRKSEEALRESERRLRSTIDGIPGLVAILAPNGEVEAVNRQIFEYTGQSLEELKNWGTNETVYHEDLPHVIEVFTKSIASGIPYQIEQRLRRVDGEYRYFDNRGIPVRDDSGRIIRWYVLLTDIEDRAQALTRLQQMQSDFAHINRVSTMGELAASLSHEILHPIATARNNARAGMRFLEMNPPNLNEAKEALGCVVRDADRAKDIVGRVRDHIKKAPPRRERFDLNGAVREALVMAHSAVARNKIVLSTDLEEGPVSVHGDRVQLQQVAVNLILNAVEAMSSDEKGARELSIRIEQGQADGGVLVHVRDSGPGIDPGNLDRVFEPFYTTKTSGVGMGLSICRSIINGHGGRLWAEANEPRGAIFQFTLPPAREDS